MDIRNALAGSNFKFNKKYGQNFIQDDRILNGIVEAAEVSASDNVLEIGVGAGTLTRALSSKAAYVYGYEIDRNLQPVLSKTLAGVDNCLVIFRDFMRESMQEVEKTIKGEYIVVANLPYYITSPIVMKLIEQSTHCKRIVVMVQKEVALRLCAKEGTADYGAITCAVDVTGDASIVMEVGRENFYPAPNVDSAVVRIDIRKDKYEPIDRVAFREVVRCAFSSRRKTFVNNLMNEFKLTREDAEGLSDRIGVDKKARGETLSTAKFVELSNIMKSSGLLS